MSARASRAACLVVALGLAACSRATPPSDPLTGIVVQTLPASGSFVLQDPSGARFTFEMDDPFVTLAHLDVHRRDRFPVIVTFRTDGDVLRATRVADRYPSPSPSPS